MRDPKRIDKVLDVVKQAWAKNPDLRFGQLILNLTTNANALYYVEDDTMIEALEKAYDIKRDK